MKGNGQAPEKVIAVKFLFPAMKVENAAKGKTSGGGSDAVLHQRVVAMKK
ncbi:MAG: hypothetical protein ACREBD_09255 [Blastocatellia bacterium]